MKKYNISIFIFRKDLRLIDNNGLIKALRKSIHVIPIFIFTPEQLINNKYKSNNCVQFMIESLNDLDNNLRNKNSKLFYFFGKPYKVILEIINNMKIDAIYVNKDYTPYSKLRDHKIEQKCLSNNIKFHSYEDILMYPIGSIKNNNGNIYNKFSPFFNTAKKITVRPTNNNIYSNYYSNKNKIDNEFKYDKNKFYKYNKHIATHGGRKYALKILNNIHKFKNYNYEKNILSIPTTRLSAYIKFGCVSIREVYYKFKNQLGMKNDLIRQLYWREFYYNITEYNPNILSTNWNDKNLKNKYKKINWIRYCNASDKQQKQFKAWCNGNTGFPIVDAAMRQLNITGYMENRGRLIVGSFLIKNLFFHWAEGEKYFSKHLIDIDVSNNTNNWMWISGSGTDSQPYFRIFNPSLQSKNYDPDCIYIKKWIPELETIDNNHIHEWNKYYNLYPNINYPCPIIDYSLTAKKTIELYHKALS